MPRNSHGARRRGLQIPWRRCGIGLPSATSPASRARPAGTGTTFCSGPRTGCTGACPGHIARPACPGRHVRAPAAAAKSTREVLPAPGFRCVCRLHAVARLFVSPHHFSSIGTLKRRLPRGRSKTNTGHGGAPAAMGCSWSMRRPLGKSAARGVIVLGHAEVDPQLARVTSLGDSHRPFDGARFPVVAKLERRLPECGGGVGHADRFSRGKPLARHAHADAQCVAAFEHEGGTQGRDERARGPDMLPVAGDHGGSRTLMMLFGPGIEQGGVIDGGVELPGELVGLAAREIDHAEIVEHDRDPQAFLLPAGEFGQAPFALEGLHLGDGSLDERVVEGQQAAGEARY